MTETKSIYLNNGEEDDTELRNTGVLSTLRSWVPSNSINVLYSTEKYSKKYVL